MPKDRPNLNIVVPEPTSMPSPNTRKRRDPYTYTVEMEDTMHPFTKIKRWIGTFACGILSLTTCCCLCCGACGNIKRPNTMVLYDEDDEDDDNTTRKVKNATEWLGVTALTVRTAPLFCGCCFGCCGLVGPMQCAMILGSVNKQK